MKYGRMDDDSFFHLWKTYLVYLFFLMNFFDFKISLDNKKVKKKIK